MGKQRSARKVTRVQPCIGSRSAKCLLWYPMVHHSRCVVSLHSLVQLSSAHLNSTGNSIYPAAVAVITANIILFSYIFIAIREDAAYQKATEVKKNQ